MDPRSHRRKAAAERALGAVPRRNRLTLTELRTSLRDLAEDLVVLETADPVKKAGLYGTLGLTLTYKPDQKMLFAEADLASRVRKVRVGEGT